MQSIIDTIETAWDKRAEIDRGDTTLREAVDHAIGLLDRGEARVAEPRDGGWHVNEWLKKAVLLSFRLRDNALVEHAPNHYYDKVPLKYAGYTAEDFARDRVRVVPDAQVRQGAYVAPDVVLMPSYTNIGAWIGSGTMVDTWATVASSARARRSSRA